MTMEANIDDIELQPQFRSVGGKLNVNYLAPMHQDFGFLNFNFWWACCWVRPVHRALHAFLLRAINVEIFVHTIFCVARARDPCDRATTTAAPRCRIPCHKRQRARSVFSGGARVSIFFADAVVFHFLVCKKSWKPRC